MSKTNSKGFTLVELLVVIGILGVLMTALFPAITSAVLKSQLSAAGMRGRNLFVSITSANQSRAALGRGSIWPRTQTSSSASSSGANQDIADKSYSSAVDYFNDLFDMDNVGSASTWRPYVDCNLNVLFGAGVNPSGGGEKLKEANVGWCVGANVPDEMEDIIPILVSRNVLCSDLLKKYGGTDDTAVGLGSNGGASWNTPFSNKGFVLVRKGGGVITPEGRYATYQIIYEKQAFELPAASSEMDAFCYLDPKASVSLKSN